MSDVQKSPPLGLATVPQAAAFLALSRGKLYSSIETGVIPHKRFGRSVRIPWQWLYQQAELPADETGEVSR